VTLDSSIFRPRGSSFALRNYTRRILDEGLIPILSSDDEMEENISSNEGFKYAVFNLQDPENL